MKVYIYVDDIRNDDSYYNKNLYPLWIPVVCRSYHDTIEAIEKYTDPNNIIDLDHDLGFDDDNYEYSGYDICKYIVENKIPLAAFHIHSMNPVGAERMRRLLTDNGYVEI